MRFNLAEKVVLENSDIALDVAKKNDNEFFELVAKTTILNCADISSQMKLARQT